MNREVEPIFPLKKKDILKIGSGFTVFLALSAFMLSCSQRERTDPESSLAPLINEQPPGEGYRGPILEAKEAPNLQPSANAPNNATP